MSQEFENKTSSHLRLRWYDDEGEWVYMVVVPSGGGVRVEAPPRFRGITIEEFPPVKPEGMSE